jgi:hypothetical protein
VGVSEKWVMQGGQVFVRRMSIDWEEEAEACIEAKEE